MFWSIEHKLLKYIIKFAQQTLTWPGWLEYYSPAFTTQRSGFGRPTKAPLYHWASMLSDFGLAQSLPRGVDGGIGRP